MAGGEHGRSVRFKGVNFGESRVDFGSEKDAGVVLQVLANAGQIMDAGNAVGGQLSSGPDAREKENLWTVKGSGAEDDFFVGECYEEEWLITVTGRE